ncbi:hypothetical protein B0J12DRAFT_572589, partial [Macrophomina phaseolina]
RLITCIASYKEWTAYATRPGPTALRTSTPVGAQRSTYWLQLTYGFALPLMLVLVALHYLTSQSLFYANMCVYDNQGRGIVREGVAGLAYAMGGMLGLSVSGIVLVGVAFVLGSLRVDTGGILNLRFCSVAMSAACHRPAGDWKAQEKAVRCGCG